MKSSRRHLLAVGAGAFASTAILRYPANAAEFNYKMGSPLAPSHPCASRTADACERIKRATGGRLDIQFFPNSALGGQARSFQQLRLGAMDLLTSGDSTMRTILPGLGIDGVPFAFASPKDVWGPMDGAIGAYCRAEIEKLDLHCFDKVWDAGFREVGNNIRPVNSPDDLKGMKLRVPADPVLVDLFKALGAAPNPIDVTELYAGLQTHLVEGLEVPLVTLESFKYYEVTKYVSYTNHQWTAYHQLVNMASWKKLPKNIQDTAGREFDAMALAGRTDLEKLNLTLETTLKGHGLVFNRPDIAPFREQVARAGLYTRWKEELGGTAWALLEKSVGKLG